jgi:hypothetical protein
MRRLYLATRSVCSPVSLSRYSTASLKFSRRRGHFAREIGSAIVELPDGKTEPDQIAQPDRHLHRLRALRQEVGGAGFEGLDANFVGLDRSDHHDWNIRELRQRTKLADEGDAVHFRHLVVDQHDIEIAFVRGDHRLEGIQECRGLNQAVGFDESLQEIEGGTAVIDEKRLSKHGSLFEASRRRRDFEMDLTRNLSHDA